jgi:hypothetical protein
MQARYSLKTRPLFEVREANVEKMRTHILSTPVNPYIVLMRM